MQTKPRRRAGEGSYFKRTRVLPSGRKLEEWCFNFSLGYGENGKRIRRCFYGQTIDEVQFKVAKARTQGGGKFKTVRAETVGGYLEDWLGGVRRSRSPVTALFYEKRVRAFAIPNIGKVRLDQIDTARIRWLYATLGERGISPDNIRKLHVSLRRAFNVAIGQGLLDRNPCAFVERPAHRPTQRAYYSAEQVATLLDASKAHRLGAMVQLGIGGALRPGELFALQWSDVSLKDGTVDVRHSLQERPRVLVPAKAKSARRIPLGRDLTAVLQKHRDAMGKEGHGSPFIFVTGRGKMMSEKVANDALRQIAAEANLPPVTMYGLRHTGISLFAEAGVHLRVAADVAGHAQTTMTSNIYTHAGHAQHRDGVQRVERLIRKARRRQGSRV